MQRGGVPRLNHQHPRLRRGDAGQLPNPHLRTINFHQNILNQARRSLAGAHARELMLHHLFGLDHLFFRFQ